MFSNFDAELFTRWYPELTHKAGQEMKTSHLSGEAKGQIPVIFPETDCFFFRAFVFVA